MKKILIALLFVLSLTSVNAQEYENNPSEQHEFKNFRVAVALGQGYIPSASNNGENFLIIPTIGLDIQYWFNQKWGLALKSDIEFSNYIVEDKNDATKNIVRENPFIISIPILISPWDNELTFIVGPGVEIEENENFSILRLGIGYEFEFGENWDFSPEFVYDLKNGQINSLTIAFGVGKRF